MAKEKRSELNIKQVDLGSIQFIDIIEHPNVNAWMEHLMETSHKEFIRLFCEDNSLRFEKLLGESLPNLPKKFNPDWGSCWKVYQSHLTWLIFTGKEGSIFLVETSLTQEEFRRESNIGIALIQFLELLKEKTVCNE